eukprot:366239-Chlamydomonas_euryale.AAC.6
MQLHMVIHGAGSHTAQGAHGSAWRGGCARQHMACALHMAAQGSGAAQRSAWHRVRMAVHDTGAAQRSAWHRGCAWQRLAAGRVCAHSSVWRRWMRMAVHGWGAWQRMVRGLRQVAPGSAPFKGCAWQGIMCAASSRVGTTAHDEKQCRLARIKGAANACMQGQAHILHAVYA